MALISFMDGNKHWFKSRLNMDVTEAPLSEAFCTLCYLNRYLPIFVIKDTLTEEIYATHPHVVGYPFIRFYAGASILINGVKVGVLCVFDQQSRPEFSIEQQEILVDLAQCVRDLVLFRRCELFEAASHCVPLHQSVLRIIREPLTHATVSKEWIADILKQIRLTNSSGRFNALIIKLHAVVSEFSNDVLFLGTILSTVTQVLHLLLQINVPISSAVIFGHTDAPMASIYTEKWWETFMQIFSFFEVVDVTPVCHIRSEQIHTHLDLLFLVFGALLTYLVPSFSISDIEVNCKDLHTVFYKKKQTLEKDSILLHEGMLQVDIAYKEIDMRRHETFLQFNTFEMIQSLHYILDWVRGYLTHDSICRYYRINMPCKLIFN